MANTIGGINLAQIANMTLQTLLVSLRGVMLKNFTTDFSSDIAAKGESVTTRVATSMSNQDLTAGFAAGDVTSTAKTITLNNYKGRVVQFTDMEVAKGTLELLKRTFIEPAAHAVLKGFIDDLLALVTAANFSQSTTITAANFDADDLADIAATLTGVFVPEDSRFAILKPAYFGSLGKDASLQSATNYGSNSVIKDNLIPRVHGFDIHEYASIPANGEALEGILGNAQGLLIAARVPAVPTDFPGSIETVTDPATGLTLQFREWYAPELGAHKLSVGVIYGVQVGVAGNLIRLVSA